MNNPQQTTQKNPQRGQAASSVPVTKGSQNVTQGGGGQRADDPALVPAIDVIEDEGGITLMADMPGATREGLSIRVEGDALTLDAPIELGESDGMQALYAEVRSPHYRRSFTLSRELDCEKIDASLKDGVLTLRVPKLEEAKPRRITVKAA